MKNIVRLLGCVFFIFLLNGCSQADRTSNFNDTDGNSQVTENSNSKKNSQKDAAKQTESNKLTFAGQAIKENKESLNDQKLELHIGDKLIESFKTDKDGYLFTHLIVDQTYRLSGKDFEVTVTAKSDDDIQVKETKGSLLLGRTIKSKQGETELLSSTIYFDKKKDSYTLSEDKKTLIVDETLDIEAGDKILLSPDTENLGGLGVEVIEKEAKKEQTVLTVDQVQPDQVLENTQYNGTVNVSEGKFTSAEGVELVKQKARKATLNVKTKIGSEKSPIKGEVSLKLDGVVETDIDVDFLNLEASTVVVKPKLTTEINTGIVVNGKIETKKDQFPLGTLEIPTGGPTTIKFAIYVHAKLDGKLEIKYKIINSFEAEVGYKDGNLIHTASAKVLEKEEVFDVKNTLTAKVGPKLATTVNILGIEGVGMDTWTGVGAKAKVSWANGKVTGNVFAFLDASFTIPILETLNLMTDAKLMFHEDEVNLSKIDWDIHEGNRDIYGKKDYVSGLNVSKERKDNPDVLIPQKGNGYSYLDTFNKYYIIEKTKDGEYRYASTGSLALHKRGKEYELEWWSGRTNIPDRPVEVERGFKEQYTNREEHPWAEKDVNYIMRWLNYWTTSEFSIVYTADIVGDVWLLNKGDAELEVSAEKGKAYSLVSKAREEERYGSKDYVSGLMISKERADKPDILASNYNYLVTSNNYYVLEKTDTGEYRYAVPYTTLALFSKGENYDLKWSSSRTNILDRAIKMKLEYDEYYQGVPQHPWKDKDPNYIMRWLNYWTTSEFRIVYSENIKECVDSLNQIGNP